MAERDRLSRLSPERRRLLERALAERARAAGAGRGATTPDATARPAARAPIPPRTGDGPPPLSFAQERFWFLHRLEPDSSEYNMTGAGRLRGALDVDALARAFDLLRARHEPLRTTFPDDGGRPRVHVASAGHADIPVEDLSARPADERLDAARDAARAFGERPYDLERGPLLRVLLLRLAADDHVLVVGQHHAVSDGWSLGVLVQEAATLYGACREGRAPPPAPAVSYGDWAAWQRARLDGPELADSARWWSERLRGAARLQLPLDRPRPAIMSHAGTTLRRRLPADLGVALRGMARARGVTLFTAMLAAFSAWLARRSGETDVVVGTAHANRDRPEVAGLLGPFVNTLALRLDLSGSPGFAELLRRTQVVTRDAWAHAELPFERLVDTLNPERDPARHPLFDVFVDQAVPVPAPDFPGLRGELVELPRTTAAFDLSFSVEDDESGVGGTFEFNTDLFDEATLRAGWSEFCSWLDAAVRDPDAPFDRLPLLDAEARRARLQAARGPARAVHDGDLVHALTVRAAMEAPGAPFLEDGARTVTGAELLERSARLANHLRGAGVGPDALVGVCLPRSADVVLAILAIWRAGGAYLPLDPADPPERLATLLADAAPPVIVTTSDLAPHVLASGSAPHCVCLDTHADAIADASAEPPDGRARADDLAYVIFTSGSTGRPKGVMITHANLTNHLAWVADAFDITPADRFLLRTPFSFDASLWEIVHPLVSGAQLVVAPPDIQRDPRALLQLVADGRISVLQTVPSMLRSWLEEPALARCTGLRHLICAGEMLTSDLARRTLDVFERHGIRARLHNLYGPSEATIDASMATCAREELRRTRHEVVPIGRPITNVDLHVLDPHGEPVPRGVVGELHVGGAGVARGYLNQPELTAARFRDDPTRPGGRLYATGDLGRERADGQLEYVGRRDDQVKLRGQRVELGEIETALSSHADVREAAVRVDDRDGRARLVAWIVPRPGARPTDGALRAHAAERLPRSMLPEVWVHLDDMPRTASEKLDRNALPAPPGRGAAPRGDGRAPRAPRDAIERALTGFVEELLDRAPVDPDADLFALGAHSLQATRLLARVAAAFGVEVPLLTVFETPRVADLADAVRAALQDGSARALPPVERAPAGPDAPLTHAQRRLWFLQRLEPESTHYTLPAALRLRGPLDAQALVRAWDLVVQRHEVLRTRFVLRDGEPRQVVQAQGPELVLEAADGVDPGARDAAALQRLAAQATRPFDPASEPLARARLLRFGPDDHALLLVQHHLISDAWSLELLAHELGAAYAADDAAAELPELPVQVADVARWQARHLDAEALADDLDWWRAQLADAPAGLGLPLDQPRPERPTHAGAHVVHTLSVELSNGLRRLARQHGTTLYVTLLASFASLLQRLCDQDDLVVGTTVAGRRPVQTEPLLGCFVNALPLRLDLGGAPSLAELLPRVERSVRAAFARQHVPFELLVDALGARRDPARPPVFDVAFDVLHQGLAAPRLPGVDARLLPYEPATSKLDLAVAVDASGEALQVHVEWDTALFAAPSVDAWCRAWHVALQAQVRDDTTPLDRLPLLDPADVPAVVAAAHTPAARGHGDVRFPRRLAAHAAATPTATALIHGEERLDYASFDRRANQLARVLRQRHGVGPGRCVALELGQGVTRMLALLAVWRAGAAWTAWQPDDPEARRLQLLAATGASLVLSTTDDGPLGDVPRADPRDVPDDTPGHVLELPDDPDATAYVLCTSGTTGEPKAVVVPWRAVDNHSAWFLEAFGLGPADVMWQRLPPSFDAALLELLGPLLSGGALVLVPDEARADPDALLELALRHGLTVLTALPSLQAALWGHPLMDALTGLHTVVAGGESMPTSLPARVAAHAERTGRPLRLLNLYGPTEATIDATLHVCDARADAAGVPIGRAIHGAHVLVVDAAGAPVPVGVVGELVVGGAGVADGYRGDPEQTSRAFVPDPFARGGADARLYRTGDRARRRHDGALLFLGRRDTQVKLAGRRLELGEVEAALAAQPGVREAVVQVRRDTSGQVTALLAVAAGDGLRVDALERGLRGALPAALVPGELVTLPELPRGVSGKLDGPRLLRLADEALGGTPAEHSAEPAAPRSLLEGDVLALVTELLGGAPLGPHDDLFARGAHSLLLVRLVDRLRERFGVTVPLRAVFEGPSVAQLADAVARLQRGEALAAAEPLDLPALAVLPDDVRPDPARRPAERPLEHVLLTGGTGFLGAYVLASLLARTRADVHLLVRAADEDDAWHRLRANLARYDLAVDEARVHVVPGELAAPRFGLDVDHWQRLAARLDAILHGAAAVDFLAGYARLAPVNVGGTLQVLRLACAGGAVPVHLVSTLGVLDVPALHGRAGASEDTPLADLAGVQGGYEQTKWVAEALAQAAGARGLPVAVHRPGRIAAHSVTGRSNPDDAAQRVLRGCVALGAYPDLPVELDVTPVDFVADALVELVRRGPPAGETYHLVNPAPTRFDALLAAAVARGHPMRAVPLADWGRLLAERVADDPRHPLFPLLPLLLPEDGGDAELGLEQVVPDVRLPRPSCARVLEHLAPTDVRCPPVDQRVLDSWLDSLHRGGWLPPPGGPT